MNQDQAEGTWDSIKGKIRSAYGELTDDDMQAAQGNVEKLFGTIQAKFGDTAEKIKEKIEQLTN